VAHPGGSGEGYDKDDAHQKEHETEDLARAIVLPGVTVACYLEYDDVCDSHDKDDRDPEPERASCGHTFPSIDVRGAARRCSSEKRRAWHRRGHKRCGCL
jgi:hypothetical protein